MYQITRVSAASPGTYVVRRVYTTYDVRTSLRRLDGGSHLAERSGRSRALEAPSGADHGMAARAKVRPSPRMLLLLVAYCAQQPLGIMAIEPPAAPTLIDHPIASGMDLLLLDGSDWVATHSGGSAASRSDAPLPATVPGDILSDLQRAGRVPDPYFNVTWREPGFVSMWNEGIWTYTKTFGTSAKSASAPGLYHLLVFDGIRMGAIVELNGRHLFNATNQFMRYVVPLPTLARAANVLSIRFGAELRIDCGRRSYIDAQCHSHPPPLPSPLHCL